ncbi:hypothetical protein P7C70_g4824, partial [Phenoliferia sp. Uapishka_3]
MAPSPRTTRSSAPSTSASSPPRMTRSTLKKENKQPQRTTPKRRSRQLSSSPDTEVDQPHEPEPALSTPPSTPTKRVRLSPVTSTPALPIPITSPSDPDASFSHLSIDASPVASTSAIPITPTRPISNIFQHAQSLLSTTSTHSHASTSSSFLGRTKERNTLVAFLEHRFPGIFSQNSAAPTRDADHTASPSPAPSATASSTTDKATAQSASLYVSGPPGIGKTALLSSVLADFSRAIRSNPAAHNVVVLMENCSSMGSVSLEAAMWERLCRGLDIPVVGKLSGRERFEAGLTSGRKFLIVLDEIDHILSAPRSSQSTSSKDLLHTLFALAHSPNSSLTLIGIANALDLTARSLRLPSSSTNNSQSPPPQVLPFKPYRAQDLANIVQQRLSKLSSTYPFVPSSDNPVNDTLQESLTDAATPPLVDQRALELCTKRVAAGTGDVRTVLGIVSKAIAIRERDERKKTIIASNDDHSATSPTLRPTVDPLSHLTPDSTRRVSIPEMMSALRLSGLSAPEALTSRLAPLQFNVRNVLVGIVVSLSRQSPDSFETKQLVTSRLNDAFEVYKEVVRKEGTLQTTLSKMEFTGALEPLESAAFLAVSNLASPPKKQRRGATKGSTAHQNFASDPVISINPALTLADLVEALKTTPAISCDLEASGAKTGAKGSGAVQETLRISCAILNEEERRIRGKKVQRKIDEMAPSEGFHGFGLDDGNKKWIGKKGKRPRKEEDEEQGEEQGGEHVAAHRQLLTDISTFFIPTVSSPLPRRCFLPTTPLARCWCPTLADALLISEVDLERGGRAACMGRASDEPSYSMNEDDGSRSGTPSLSSLLDSFPIPLQGDPHFATTSPTNLARRGSANAGSPPPSLPPSIPLPPLPITVSPLKSRNQSLPSPPRHPYPHAALASASRECDVSSFDPRRPPKIPLPITPPPPILLSPGAQSTSESLSSTTSSRLEVKGLKRKISFQDTVAVRERRYRVPSPLLDTTSTSTSDLANGPEASPVDFEELLSKKVPKRLSRRNSRPLSIALSPSSFSPPHSPFDEAALESGGESSPESDIDLEASLEALAYKLGVRRDLLPDISGSEELDEYRGEASDGHGAADRLRSVLPTSRRPTFRKRNSSYRVRSLFVSYNSNILLTADIFRAPQMSYKLVRKASLETAEERSGELSSEEEETFDLSFDSHPPSYRDDVKFCPPLFSSFPSPPRRPTSSLINFSGASSTSKSSIDGSMWSPPPSTAATSDDEDREEEVRLPTPTAKPKIENLPQPRSSKVPVSPKSVQPRPILQPRPSIPTLRSIRPPSRNRSGGGTATFTSDQAPTTSPTTSKLQTLPSTPKPPPEAHGLTRISRSTAPASNPNSNPPNSERPALARRPSSSKASSIPRSPSRQSLRSSSESENPPPLPTPRPPTPSRLPTPPRPSVLASARSTTPTSRRPAKRPTATPQLPQTTAIPPKIPTKSLSSLPYIGSARLGSTLELSLAKVARTAKAPVINSN